MAKEDPKRPDLDAAEDEPETREPRPRPAPTLVNPIAPELGGTRDDRPLRTTLGPDEGHEPLGLDDEEEMREGSAEPEGPRGP